MRLLAGRSTFAIGTPVAARIGNSHSKFPGRTLARGRSFSPWPNCLAPVQALRKRPWTLQGELSRAWSPQRRSCLTAGVLRSGRASVVRLPVIRPELGLAKPGRERKRFFASFDVPFRGLKSPLPWRHWLKWVIVAISSSCCRRPRGSPTLWLNAQRA